eukprot:m.10524 g.10524  ORF g.10524 m.10524 type:complete len:89 (+) comp7072_c0_seq1:86-352(+)
MADDWDVTEVTEDIDRFIDKIKHRATKLRKKLSKLGHTQSKMSDQIKSAYNDGDITDAQRDKYDRIRRQDNCVKHDEPYCECADIDWP